MNAGDKPMTDPEGLQRLIDESAGKSAPAEGTNDYTRMSISDLLEDSHGRRESAEVEELPTSTSISTFPPNLPSVEIEREMIGSRYRVAVSAETAEEARKVALTTLSDWDRLEAKR